jgi:hypothetical protein
MIHTDADDNPEAAFAAALPRQAVDEMPKFETAIPKSPDFGDFGGFEAQGITGGFWDGRSGVGNGGDADDGWGATPSAASGEDSWGGDTTRQPEPSMDTDWQAAQRNMQLKDALAVSVVVCAREMY